MFQQNTTIQLTFPPFQPDTQLQFRRTSKDSSVAKNNLKNKERKLSADSVGKSRKKSSVVEYPKAEAPSPNGDGKTPSITQKKVNTDFLVKVYRVSHPLMD